MSWAGWSTPSMPVMPFGSHFAMPSAQRFAIARSAGSWVTT